MALACVPCVLLSQGKQNDNKAYSLVWGESIDGLAQLWFQNLSFLLADFLSLVLLSKAVCFQLPLICQTSVSPIVCMTSPWSCIKSSLPMPIDDLVCSTWSLTEQLNLSCNHLTLIFAIRTFLNSLHCRVRQPWPHPHQSLVSSRRRWPASSQSLVVSLQPMEAYFLTSSQKAL